MTDLQINRAVRASVDAHNLYVTANRIGITHSTLTRYLGGMKCQHHVLEKIAAFAGKPLAPAPAAKLKAVKPAKAAKPKKAKAKAAKKAKAPKVAKAKKTSKPKASKKKPLKASKKKPAKRKASKPKAVEAPPSGPTVAAEEEEESSETAAE